MLHLYSPTVAVIFSSRPLSTFYTTNHIFQFHLMVKNILHNKASWYGCVALIYHKHDKAFRL